MSLKAASSAPNPHTYCGAGRATAAGLVVIACWSALALLTRYASPLLPFELLALSFAIACVSNSVLLRHGLRGLASWRQAPAVWIFASSGLFVYHALYFAALNQAPVAQASLIAYLWPFMIVLMSTLTARQSFQPRHLIGAAMGFLDTVFVILGPSLSGDDLIAASLHEWAGYAAAAYALMWSIYSVANGRFRAIPSGMIGGVCGLVALAGAGLHLLLETTVELSLS
ncbi:MAG: EamA family transporter [Candidatus Devosia symbiotica]|nr:EamA family transporter [Candidatus Devosia symbiotica]